MFRDKKTHYKTSVEKELKVVKKQEDSLRRAAMRQETPRWRSALTDKVPQKVYHNLEKAFCKAFEIIFEKGTGIIEKTYSRESIEENHEIQAFTFQVKADRKSLKKIRRDAKTSHLRNMAITSAEGLGLGALGIGLPDIVIFAGVLLKGLYELALRYGFDYDSGEERYFILKVMETAMQKKDSWEICNQEVDRFIREGLQTEDRPELVNGQIVCTAKAFAVDMVLLKFIQGLPVVGMIGGAANPVYYNRVMKYAELKYRKRYLLGLQTR